MRNIILIFSIFFTQNQTEKQFLFKTTFTFYMEPNSLSGHLQSMNQSKQLIALCEVFSILKENQRKPSDLYQLASISNFPKNKLTDFISILETVGCAKQTTRTQIIYLGLENTKQTIFQIADENISFDREATLHDIVRVNKAPTYENLTQSLFLIYISLGIQHLHIKQVEKYLSLNGKHDKLISRKLRFIFDVLEAATILTKTRTPGEYFLQDQFFTSIQPYVTEHSTQMDLCALISRPVPFIKNPYLDKRRSELPSIEETSQNSF